MLPANKGCRWSHKTGIDERRPCTFQNGSAPAGYDDLVRCMQEAACNITDSRDQMAVLRDPRAVAVSTYYYLDFFRKVPSETVDEFVLSAFPVVCQWMMLRYILFGGTMFDQRTISFWYQDTLTDPVSWHRQLHNFVGLQLPESVAKAVSNATMQRQASFRWNRISKHHGGFEATRKRSYVNEIKAETSLRLDEMLVSCTPPALRSRFNISESA